MGKTKKEKKVKAKKDKDAPKRAISAFFFYNKERRPLLAKEQPSLNNKEIISTMSKEWNALSEEKKTPYNKIKRISSLYLQVNFATFSIRIPMNEMFQCDDSNCNSLFKSKPEYHSEDQWVLARPIMEHFITAFNYKDATISFMHDKDILTSPLTSTHKTIEILLWILILLIGIIISLYMYIQYKKFL